jgi:hypothetical protein
MDDFCLTHGYEHMKRQFGNPIPYCQACQAERTIVRCDQCDNGIESDWEFCAWCGCSLREPAPCPDAGPQMTFTDEQVDAALKAWFAGPQTETNMGLERSMRAAMTAAAALPSRQEDWRPVAKLIEQAAVHALFNGAGEIINPEIFKDAAQTLIAARWRHTL